MEEYKCLHCGAIVPVLEEEAEEKITCENCNGTFEAGDVIALEENGPEYWSDDGYDHEDDEPKEGGVAVLLRGADV